MKLEDGTLDRHEPEFDVARRNVVLDDWFWPLEVSCDGGESPIAPGGALPRFRGFGV